MIKMCNNILDDTYIHYGSKYDDNFSFREILKGEKYCPIPEKPKFGLYASNIETNESWYRWCKGENFNTDKLNKYFTFNLKENSRILYVFTEDDILPYVIKSRYGIRYNSKTAIGDTFKDSLYEDYDGMYVHYNPELRNGMFYTWDCSTLVLWNKDKICNIVDYDEEDTRDFYVSINTNIFANNFYTDNICFIYSKYNFEDPEENFAKFVGIKKILNIVDKINSTPLLYVYYEYDKITRYANRYLGDISKEFFNEDVSFEYNSGGYIIVEDIYEIKAVAIAEFKRLNCSIKDFIKNHSDKMISLNQMIEEIERGKKEMATIGELLKDKSILGENEKKNTDKVKLHAATQITCKECGEDFILSDKNAKWYKENGMELPKRCPECRKKKLNSSKENKEIREIVHHIKFNFDNKKWEYAGEININNADINSEIDIKFNTEENAKKAVEKYNNNYRESVQDIKEIGEYTFVQCKECGEYFRLSYSDLKWYLDKGFQAPKKCKKCRNKNKNNKRDNK